MRLASYVLLLIGISSAVWAQSPPPSTANPVNNLASQATPPGDSTSITADLDRLQSFASQSAQALAGLHIDKWKANPAAKSAAQSNSESLQRNLGTALPGLIEAARATPNDVNAQFKLYRDVNALYEVFDSVTEATRIFGQKSQYENLSAQQKTLASVRRNLGVNLEDLTASTQFELKQLRAEVKNQQQKLALAEAATAEAQKQVVLAQAELQKKPAAPKKKTVAKKPAAATNATNSSSTASNGTSQQTALSSTPKQ